MKNIFKILSLIVFVLAMSSCQKENDVLVQENETENQFKIAEEEEIMHIQHPNIHGQIIISFAESLLGVSIDLNGQTLSYAKNTIVDEGGNYSFLNLQPGTYTGTVLIGGEISSTITYIVSY